MKFSKIVSSAALLSVSAAHSWIHCTDYRGDVNYFSEEDCHGHPRIFNGELPRMFDFGVDRGFDEQRTPTDLMQCQTVQPSLSEVATHDIARYRQGETYTLAWPSKNHVAAPCTNPYIPDTSLELFIEPFSAGGDPALFSQVVDASFSREPHEHGKIDFKGFQHCPAFCENMDKSLCTGTFVVPADLADGYYTFQWRWVFNSGTAAYVTCFEAYIGQDVTPVESPTTRPTSDNGDVPTPAPTDRTECTGEVGLYGQCAGGNSGSPSCCVGGASCMRQSEWYSQCLMACPSGWECESETVATEAPTVAPTVSPAPPTPIPTPVPSPSPIVSTSAPTPNSPLDLCGCEPGFSTRGRIRDSGNVVVQAVVENDCGCQKLCSYAIGSVVFSYDESSGRCKCFDSYRKIQEKKNISSWVGQVVVEATTNDM